MSTKIDWADETINPLGWGCYGPTGSKEHPRPCPYCYAKEWSKRHLRGCPDCDAFIPHWHPEQFEKMAHWCKPRTIFIQSMGDLFHVDTPTEHIEATLAACRAHPRHTYMFLTKNPGRYSYFDFRAEDWLGVTVESNMFGYRLDILRDVLNNMEKYGKVRPKSFVSIEPLLGNCSELLTRGIDRLIVGAMTGDPKKVIKPERAWIGSIVAKRGRLDIQYKDNIKPFLEEYGLVV